MPESLDIGLDWDGTVTADLELWSAFVESAKVRGHRVFIVTFRSPLYPSNSDIQAFSDKHGLVIVYSNGKPKREAAEKEGVWVDIWIDDMPGLI